MILLFSKKSEKGFMSQNLMFFTEAVTNLQASKRVFQKKSKF